VVAPVNTRPGVPDHDGKSAIFARWERSQSDEPRKSLWALLIRDLAVDHDVGSVDSRAENGAV